LLVKRGSWQRASLRTGLPSINAAPTQPGLKPGIRREHGGDHEFVKFCHRAGLTYVSCSPFRVPVARLAAAQASLEEEAAKKTKKK